MVEEAAGAFDGKIVSSEPTGTLIGQSAFLCGGEKTLGNFLHYTTISFICNAEEFFLRTAGGSGRLTRFLTLMDNAGHERRLRSTFLRSPRPSLYVVQSAHEETARRQRAIYSLHLSEMHLPTHNATRVQACSSKPGTLNPTLRYLARCHESRSVRLDLRAPCPSDPRGGREVHAHLASEVDAVCMALGPDAGPASC